MSIVLSDSAVLYLTTTILALAVLAAVTFTFGGRPRV